MYQLYSINKNEGGLNVIGYFETYYEAENLKKLIELYSEAFNKYITSNDRFNFTKLCHVQKDIERVSGLNLIAIESNENLEIKEIKTSTLHTSKFNLFEHSLKTFDKPRTPLYNEGERVTIKGYPNGLGHKSLKYLSKYITGTIVEVSKYESGTSYMDIPEGFSYLIKSNSFEDCLSNELWFHESSVEMI